MHPLRVLCAAAALTAVATAQNFLYLPASLSPATVEGPQFHSRPFMQTHCRVQMFFDATETGSSSFTATALSLRYDGPIPQVGAPGPFAIQRLRLSVGTTTVAMPAAAFAQNLSQPLTTAFDAPVSYFPDPGSTTPEPFGNPSGTLRFQFSTPVAVTIPSGGWFVIDLQMTGNNIAGFGFAHAIVDAFRVNGGVVDGSVFNYGTGCAIPSQPDATIGTTGVHAPGAAHFISGQNLGANTLVIGVLGGSNTTSEFGPLPFTLPGTSCSLLTSIDLSWLFVSNASGALPANQQATAIAVPPDPAFAGVTVYEQLIALAPGANPFDLIASDARAITLGSVQPPSIGVYAVSHGADADAGVADKVEPFGYAVRLEVN
jgi:hypothetical protein